ncbi:MAG: hypothetical protein ACXVZ4_08605 [Gaiellaceae bacterium]
MKKPTLALGLSFIALAAAACEPFGDKDKEALKKACPAEPAHMQTAPTLPGNFPTAAGISYEAVTKDGPATVATGFMNLTIGAAHQAWSQAIKGASGFAVTKEEQDAADSEVNFSGNGNSGQVKMVQVCKSRTNVTITIRPA